MGRESLHLHSITYILVDDIALYKSNLALNRYVMEIAEGVLYCLDAKCVLVLIADHG